MQVREIDAALRRLAKQKAGLDAEEAHWLRLADQQDAWREMGYVHALEYLEVVFGYSPRTAAERLRVARELGELPALETALRDGDATYSVVREISRVATPATVERWLEHTRGKNLREVEQLVSGRKKGDDPDDRPDPNLVKHGVWLQLDAESLAIWRQMRMALDEELGEKLDDKQFIAALGARVSAPDDNDDAADENEAVATVDDRDSPLRPSHMIHISTCRHCKRAWQDGAGVRIEIPARVLERAECDAILCDDETGMRAKHSIPPVTKRRVSDRDEYRCRVPGCRSARNLDVHHVIHREHGGTHDPSNLLVLCRGHHKLHHDGVLVISGRAPDDLVFTRTTPSPVQSASFEHASPTTPMTIAQLARTIEEALRG